MKTAIMKRPSVHIIPLIIFAMLMLYGTSVFANQVQKNKPGFSKSAGVITLAKGQAYVPPQKNRSCSG